MYLCSVSNIQVLFNKFRQSPLVGEITNTLNETPQVPLQLKGLRGSQRAFVIAATVQTQGSPHHHLVIAESKEDAAYLHNDLTAIQGEQSTWLFPDSFKRPTVFEDINSTQVLQRSETVNKMTAHTATAGIIVSYPEALFEKVVQPAVLLNNRIILTVGETCDVDFIMEVLLDYGFVRTDFVYEPGQFSLRGGIVDLFSYGNALPYRIELFDTEVERIRTFDPLTQLSSQSMPSVSIIPNLNTRFTQQEKASLFHILPEGSVIWMKDEQFILERLQYCFNKVEEYAQKVTVHDPAELREIFRDRAFVYPGELVEDMNRRSRVIY
jgi:transcription-repair coupling factor (superfamily II helicase)